MYVHSVVANSNPNLIMNVIKSHAKKKKGFSSPQTFVDIGSQLPMDMRI